MYSNPRTVIVEIAPNIFSRNISVYLELSHTHHFLWRNGKQNLECKKKIVHMNAEREGKIKERRDSGREGISGTRAHLCNTVGVGGH